MIRVVRSKALYVVHKTGPEDKAPFHSTFRHLQVTSCFILHTGTYMEN